MGVVPGAPGPSAGAVFPLMRQKTGEHSLNKGRRQGRGQTSVTVLLCCKLHAKQEPLVFQELRVLELTVLTSLAEPFLLNHTTSPGCAVCVMQQGGTMLGSRGFLKPQ